MRFQTYGRIEFGVSSPTRFFFNLHVLTSPGQHIERESLQLLPNDAMLLEQPAATGMGRLVSITASSDLTVSYEAEVTCTPDLRTLGEVADWPAAPLDHTRAAYLFPSRYCESDQVGRFAWQKFGGFASPFARASAVRDWLRANLAYVSGSTHAGTSACTILVQRAGVCRDFAHLGVALCRALNLPARYVTGYACHLQPPDMHAWFEVAIGPGWLAFDATGLAPINGLVRVAHGRDAADTAIVTAYGPAVARLFQFSCQPADMNEAFSPVFADQQILFSDLS